MVTAEHSRDKLIQTAIDVVLRKGYAATTVDDICAASGVTKGSFFHHFRSKEQSILAATDRWSERAESIFGEAAYRHAADPRARVLGYIDLRIAMLQGDLTEFTCLLGTLVQETFDTSPAIRAACDRGLELHLEDLTRDIAEAKGRSAPKAAWEPSSLARFAQAALQGAFVLAKAKGGPEVAVACMLHLRRYFESLLGQKAITRISPRQPSTAARRQGAKR